MHTQPVPPKGNTYSMLVVPTGIFRFNHVDGKTWLFIEGRWLPIPDMTDVDAADKLEELNRPDLPTLRLQGPR